MGVSTLRGVGLVGSLVSGSWVLSLPIPGWARVGRGADWLPGWVGPFI